MVECSRENELEVGVIASTPVSSGFPPWLSCQSE